MILIADHSKSTLELLKDCFQIIKYLNPVQVFYDGKSILSFLENCKKKDFVKIDLILLADNLLDFDVLELLKKVDSYNDKKSFNIPIIIISEANKSDLLPKAFENGASDYIQKPVQKFEFLSRVKSILKLFHIIREYRNETKKLQNTLDAVTEANQVFFESSGKDGLTKLANRRQLDISFENEWKFAIRERSLVAVLMIDIDSFKSYNDLYGHQAGDLCLIKVAEIIKSSVSRPSDIVARYGGEEFILILPNTNINGAIYVAKSIHKTLEKERILHEGSEVANFVTISIGIAATVAQPDSISPQNLVKAADDMLYSAKKSGKNCYCTIFL